ncbi:MAG: hypothetical protein IIA67_06605, partial [Planctomycetes bacterium]|nr:hypothetical protein [Planctomycetota bacterium]
MRSSGLFFVAALILAGAVAGCSETKTPEAATEAGKSTTSPEQPGAGEVAVQPIGVGRRVAGNPAASNPGAGNPGAAVKVSASKPLSVHDLTKPELEAAIVKLSVYRGGDTSTAELGLAHFLQALRTRDVVAAEQLLTSVARVEAQLSQNSINLAEMSFTERTRFKIGKP